MSFYVKDGNNDTIKFIDNYNLWNIVWPIGSIYWTTVNYSSSDQLVTQMFNLPKSSNFKPKTVSVNGVEQPFFVWENITNTLGLNYLRTENEKFNSTGDLILRAGNSVKTDEKIYCWKRVS